MGTELSRRNFLGMAGVTAAIAGLGLAGCSSASEPSSSSNEIEWSESTDVVIMGLGAAGATAAVQAAKDGAEVIVFEKAPEEYAGGNSTVCEGAAYIPTADTQGTFDVYRQWAGGNVSDDEINGFVTQMQGLQPWLDANGITYSMIEFSDRPELAFWGPQDVSAGIAGVMMSPTFWASVKMLVDAESGIDVRYETPVTGLIFDPATKEVFGVKVTEADGTVKNIKARKGVVMACGSFEFNRKMLTDYVFDPLPPVYGLGTPYNTGDGIKIVSEIGAEIRHAGYVEWGAFCSKPATEEIGMAVAMKNNLTGMEHLIEVNRKGLRFVNETGTTQVGENSARPCHDKDTLPELDYDGIALEYSNLPFWFVFDAERAKTPICSWSAEDASSSWNGRHKFYTWSTDNEAEVEKGWVVKANTIEELAEKAGIDPAGLAQTVAEYNAACEAGKDDKFGRTVGLTPLSTPPFYAAEMSLCFINAQGGAARDGQNRVLNYAGEPIPRLYSAGEFGSIWSRMYHGACNVPEALCGYAVGANVAALDPWSED